MINATRSNKIFSLIFIFSLIIITYSLSFAQNTSGSKLLACSNLSEGSLLFYKAMYLLQELQYGFEISECLEDEYKKADALAPIPRIELGIQQLEKVNLANTRLSLTNNDIKLFIASGKTKLSKLYLEKNEFALSENLMKEARDIYISIVPSEVKTRESVLLVAKIATGLIRCNKIFDALQVLNKLPDNNPNRAYLTAEIYFSLGNRELAAKKYEQWITLGCKSDFFMFLGDEFGEIWDLGLSTVPPDLTLCEQLPIEVRARFETLMEQYRHPNNLPVRNFPPIFLPNLRY